MKKKITVIVGGIIILLASSTAMAQEGGIMNPKMGHVLTDTTLLRATEVTIGPGEKSDMHTHPAHFFYALTEGKLIVHFKDGKKETYDLKPGDSGFSAPERPHIVENSGNTTVKFLIVELKEHPYKETKTKK